MVVTEANFALKFKITRFPGDKLDGNSKGATFEFKNYVKVLFTIEGNILSKRIMQLDIDFRNKMIISNRNHKSCNSNMKKILYKKKKCSIKSTIFGVIAVGNSQ